MRQQQAQDQQSQRQQFSQQQLREFVAMLNSREAAGELVAFFLALPQYQRDFFVKSGDAGVDALEKQQQMRKSQQQPKQPTSQQSDSQIAEERKRNWEKLIVALMELDPSGGLLAFLEALPSQVQLSVMLDGANGAPAVQVMFLAETNRKVNEAKKQKTERRKREAEAEASKQQRDKVWKKTTKLPKSIDKAAKRANNNQRNWLL